jgi:hypothetical protein
MTRAVHWLYTKTVIFDLEQEQIVLVVFIVTGCLPKLEVVNVGGNDFLVTSHSVFIPHKVDKLIINLGSLGVKETTSW